MAREVWITGSGLLSPLGEGTDEWWPKLFDPATIVPLIDAETYKPFSIYPIGDFDLDSQIPRPGDQRAMGPLMHYGCYTAGRALEAAGLKDNEELLAQIHMLVASGGGERDSDLDQNILQGLDEAGDRGVFLNEQLSNELRPTMFLAQLPNLFAGNISIVHGVAGSSRTFMGEEAAGTDTLRIAFERILAGQGDLFLVGAAYNSARHDMLHLNHAGGYVLSEPVGNLWRRPKNGCAFGSAGAFLVVEASDHAEARGAKPTARVRAVLSDLSDRMPGSAAAVAQAQWESLAGGVTDRPLAVISGATGSGPITSEEHGFLTALTEQRGDIAVRGTGRATGHSFEASFLANTIFGISCLERGEVFAPLSPEEPLEMRVEKASVDQVLIIGWGLTQGEGMALLEAIDG